MSHGRDIIEVMLPDVLLEPTRSRLRFTEVSAQLPRLVAWMLADTGCWAVVVSLCSRPERYVQLGTPRRCPRG